MGGRQRRHLRNTLRAYRILTLVGTDQVTMNSLATLAGIHPEGISYHKRFGHLVEGVGQLIEGVGQLIEEGILTQKDELIYRVRE